MTPTRARDERSMARDAVPQAEIAPRAAGGKMGALDILIEDDRWSAIPLAALAARVFGAMLDDLGLEPGRFAVSILACGDTRIARLNAAFRGKPAPANVLSWPAEDRTAAVPGEMPRLPRPHPSGPPLDLGDVALSHGAIAREAAAAGCPFARHLTHLLAHGALHLLGFDHIDDADAALMEGIETRVLVKLGAPDPY